MTRLAPEWVRTSDPVIRSPARYRWTTAPAVSTMEYDDTVEYAESQHIQPRRVR